MVNGEHDVYFHHNYFDRFVQDIREARSLIIIHAPFLGGFQIEQLSPHIMDARKRSVRVCIFLELPTRPQTAEEAAKFNRLCQRLRGMGVHVNLRAKCHEKLAIMDDRVGWDASLNYLSYLDTTERLTRWTCHEKVLEMVASHALDDCEGCRSVAGFCRKDRKVAEIALLEALGKSLAERRKRLRLKQEELASMLDLRQADISLLETGKGTPTLATLVRVCVALGLGFRSVPWFVLPMMNDFVKWQTARNPPPSLSRVRGKRRDSDDRSSPSDAGS